MFVELDTMDFHLALEFILPSSYDGWDKDKFVHYGIIFT